MAAPIVMMVNSSLRTSCPDLIKAILKEEVLPAAEESLDINLHGYRWHISNKYYTAEVLLCHHKDGISPTKFIPEEMEAVISIIDDTRTSFNDAKSYWSKIDYLDPATRIIVCHGFTKTGDIHRREVIEWCIDNSFELVELTKSEFDDEEEEEDEFQEPYGPQRINQALYAHNWPNLEMKDRDEREIARQLQIKLGLSEPEASYQGGTPEENGYQQLPGSESAAAKMESEEDPKESKAESGQDEGGSSKSGGTEHEQHTDPTALDDDMALLQALGNEDPGDESFGELFAKMAAMKERAAAMPIEERKRYAETVAVSFWKAIGGDADEIDGLSSDEDVT